MDQFTRIKNIFMDAGGVILDEHAHESSCAFVITKVLSSFNPSYSLEQYWNDVSEAVFRFAPNVYNYVIWKNIQRLSDYRYAVSEFRKERKNPETTLSLTDGLRDVVPTLARRFRIGIIGQHGQGLTQILSDKNLLQFFSFPFTQEEFSITKPDPRYYLQVLDRAGVAPRESVMVGDRIDKDIIPAKAIGMNTIRIVTGIHSKQEPRTPKEAPDAQISTIRDLPKILGI